MQILIFPFAKQRNTKISHYYISIKIYIFWLSWRVQIISAYPFQITLSCPHIVPLSHDNFFQVELPLNIRNNFKKWKLTRFISCLSWMCLLSLSVFLYVCTCNKTSLSLIALLLWRSIAIEPLTSVLITWFKTTLHYFGHIDSSIHKMWMFVLPLSLLFPLSLPFLLLNPSLLEPRLKHPYKEARNSANERGCTQVYLPFPSFLKPKMCFLIYPVTTRVLSK